VGPIAAGGEVKENIPRNNNKEGGREKFGEKEGGRFAL